MGHKHKFRRRRDGQLKGGNQAMLSEKRIIPLAVRNIALVLLGVLIALLGQAATTSVATARIMPDEQPAAGSAGLVSATAGWVSCVPIQVVTFASRVHVQCQTAIGGVSYFAASTTNAANVARILSVLTAAQLAGRTLSILYDPADTSGTAIGCQAGDCRLIQAVGFGQ